MKTSIVDNYVPTTISQMGGRRKRGRKSNLKRGGDVEASSEDYALLDKIPPASSYDEQSSKTSGGSTRRRKSRKIKRSNKKSRKHMRRM